MSGITILDQNSGKYDVGKPVQQTAEQKAQEVKAKQLKKACADFESLLIYNMLKTMRNTIPKSGLLNSFPGKDTYNMLIDQQIAADMAKAGNGLGLQKILYEQLTKSLNNKSAR
jgi:flagellar protein FlgJ